jgi:hypothetical protein
MAFCLPTIITSRFIFKTVLKGKDVFSDDQLCQCGEKSDVSKTVSASHHLVDVIR